MAAPKTQQRGSIVDAKDLRYFLRIASKNWYFVAVALVLSSVLSYLYSYKLPDIYGASTQILLEGPGGVQLPERRCTRAWASCQASTATS